VRVEDLDGRLTITVPEAGTLLGLGRGAAYAAARRGELPVLKIGARLLVPVPRLLELVGHDGESFFVRPISEPSGEDAA
jgi:hypothetical protein